MQVILLEKIGKLGELGQQVNVKPGYGRNFLIPSGKAVPATPDNITKFEAQRTELEKAQAETFAAAQARADGLNTLELALPRKIVSDDRLYGSVGTHDIIEAAQAAGQEITKHEVRLPDGPFRALGEYEVELQLHADVHARIKLKIVAEQEQDAA
ncbi:MAG: 50S ribosomal protein L9 [Gammaproteobacteria bacterium]|nr:50S ribosomal protein L9 [Gammaproteobacteria bacterium]MCY4338753.1 50S ribosomal protein L9 [Gammaproteobacteria bacterium]